MDRVAAEEASGDEGCGEEEEDQANGGKRAQGDGEGEGELSVEKRDRTRIRACGRRRREREATVGANQAARLLRADPPGTGRVVGADLRLPRAAELRAAGPKSTGPVETAGGGVVHVDAPNRRVAVVHRAGVEVVAGGVGDGRVAAVSSLRVALPHVAFVLDASFGVEMADPFGAGIFRAEIAVGAVDGRVEAAGGTQRFTGAAGIRASGYSDAPCRGGDEVAERS